MSRQARVMALEVAELMIAQGLEVTMRLNRKEAGTHGIPADGSDWLIDVEVHDSGNGLLFEMTTHADGPLLTSDIADFDELADRIAEECRFRRDRREVLAWGLDGYRSGSTLMMAGAAIHAGQRITFDDAGHVVPAAMEGRGIALGSAVRGGVVGVMLEPHGVQALRLRGEPRADGVLMGVSNPGAFAVGDEVVTTGGIMAAGRAIVDSFMGEQVSAPLDGLISWRETYDFVDSQITQAQQVPQAFLGDDGISDELRRGAKPWTHEEEE